MAKTTELVRRSEMPRRGLDRCHDGEGTLDFTEVYSARRSGMPTSVRFVHDDVLPPGVSIGRHRHGESEEFYYVVSGSGLMQLDDEEFQVSAGDVTVVYPGGSHGLVNNTNEPLRIIVVGAAPRE